MNNISDIVNVTITRETTAVEQASFGKAMILGTHKLWNDRIRFYSTLAEMVDDGFETTTNEYKAAQKLVGQNPRVTTFAIGRRSVDVATVVVSTVTASSAYTITINDEDITYTSAGSGDDATDIGEALEGLINAASTSNSWGLTAVNTTGTIVITQAVANTAWSLTVGSKLTISAFTASDDIEDDLTAINNANDTWYGLIITSRVSQDVQDVAAWVEANKKIFGTASADANILDGAATSDIAYILKNANYSRTFVLYHEDAATVYPEAAWFGVQLPKPPGSSTWAFKSLAGIDASELTTSQRTNAYAKNANSYETRNAVAITKNGKMASGENIDVIRGLDWQESIIVTDVYSLLINNPKIAFTDAGVANVESVLRAALSRGVQQGVLAADPEFTVTVPKVADVSTNDKANRNLPDVTFAANLAGAIHAVTIAGTVSV